MKNYAEGIDEARTFITFFDETEDKLIVHFGSGESYPIPKTPENLKKVLNKMKEQIESYVNTSKKTKLDESLNKRWIYLATFSGTFVIFSILSMIAIVVDGFTPALITGLLGTVLPASILTILTSVMYFPLRSKVNDIEKNEYFNKNCEVINEYLKRNKNVLNNSSKSIKRTVKKMEINH